MARDLELKTNVVPPSGDYPDGRIQNDDGSGNGTPVTEAVYGDFHQFFAKLLRDAGIAANNLPDNTTNEFQLNDALNLSVKLFDNEFGWETASITLAPGWTTNATYPLEVRKIGNKVEWRGIISRVGTQATGTAVLTGFGAAIRPLVNKYHAVGISQAGSRHAALEFESGGGAEVLLHFETAGSDITIYFDGISYYV